ncbi:MAG: hypothetical protein BWZ03_00011 [bacterium ADurb.BinA186]|nr:MAG: hypothetical protein BWZ03_00011 [bacterium ADurb.BinA186]
MCICASKRFTSLLKNLFKKAQSLYSHILSGTILGRIMSLGSEWTFSEFPVKHAFRFLSLKQKRGTKNEETVLGSFDSAISFF